MPQPTAAYSWQLSGLLHNRSMSCKNTPRAQAPHVTLVGAGPGDPDLLTLKAVKAIANATVLLVDDLVSEAVLSHACPKARVVHVGKRGGCRSTPQAFIEKRMLQEALAGENVVRLKGGDPFVFGRGGEEVAYLQAHGVSVTVINGITAGLAGVTALGAPLTHRDHAHGVVFVTGHAKQDADNRIDWQGLARTAAQAKLTLVIYMGVKNAADIQSDLLCGLTANTPVAVVQNVSLPNQRQVVCTLGDMCQTMTQHAMGSPCVMVVGHVLQGLLALQAPTPRRVNG